ncbi:hypothetical protein [Nostoc sp.]|uniref:hypothetical protein n=1 Tax=Nostoc sp. TaxID=1180 RepID=UPI002FF48801
MSSCHQVCHYSTLLLPYKINTIRKKTKALTFVRHWALGIGHWALGIGHWALGMGHWALAWGVGYFSPIPLIPRYLYHKIG